VSDGVPLDRLFGAAVRVGDVRIGLATGILVDDASERVIGLEVSAQRGGRWFLPWVAAAVREDGVEAASTLVFGTLDQLEAYLRRGAHIVRSEEASAFELDEEGHLGRRTTPIRVSPDVPGGTTPT